MSAQSTASYSNHFPKLDKAMTRNVSRFYLSKNVKFDVPGSPLSYHCPAFLILNELLTKKQIRTSFSKQFYK